MRHRWLSRKRVAMVLCGLVALYCVGQGIAVLSAPQRIAASLGLSFAAPLGYSEFTTVYGGFYIGIGAFLALGVFRNNYLEPGLAFLALSSTAAAAVRLGSLVVFDVRDTSGAALLGAEIVLAIVGWVGVWLARAPHPSYD